MEVGLIRLTLPDGTQVTSEEHGPATLEVLESIYQGCIYRVTFWAVNQPTKWNAAMASGVGGLGTLEWMGVTGTEQKVSTKRTFRMHEPFLHVRGNVCTIEISGTDQMVDLKRYRPQRAFKEKTIEEMLQQIAKDHKLKTILDIDVKTKFTLLQCGMSDYEFIQDVLLLRTGPDPTVFYMRDGNTLVVQARRQKNAKALGELFFSMKEPTLYSDTKKIYAPDFKATLLIGSSNYGGTLTVGFDKTKESGEPYLKTYLANDSTHTFDPFGAKKLTPFLSKPSEIQPILVEPELRLDNELKIRSSWDAPFTMYRMAIPCHFMPQSNIGGLAYFDGQVGDMSTSLFCSGTYYVYAVHHTIAPRGQVATIVFLERRGYNQDNKGGAGV